MLSGLSVLQVTELLYTKQTQLERMAAEKAAQQLAHERQIAQAKDDVERVKRCGSCFMQFHAGCCLCIQHHVSGDFQQNSCRCFQSAVVEGALAQFQD